MLNTLFTKKIVAVSLASSLALSAAIAYASTESHSNDEHGDSHMSQMSFGEPGDLTEVSKTIEVTMYDNYYEPEEIEVQAGQTVRFVVKNNGDLLHEFNIGTASMHAKHQDEMATMMAHGMIEPDKINHSMMNMDMGHGGMAHNDANSVLLEPGQSGEIIWKFNEASELQFACNIPGHYESGMMGPVHMKKEHHS
ncbi:cupredoxin domain-containing protein [Curvivirga sp.]|uniref:cupredoxin domain-containing protein n=1 Tax=Curvivirga sp. TaxID=2856848 RepID=UPI003B5C2552